MVTGSPVFAAGPVPSARSLVIRCAGGSQSSGMVMVGAWPKPPATLTSSAVHSRPWLAGAAAWAGALDEAAAEVVDDEDLESPLPQAVSVTAAATTTVAPRILASVCMRGTITGHTGTVRARVA